MTRFSVEPVPTELRLPGKWLVRDNETGFVAYGTDVRSNGVGRAYFPSRLAARQWAHRANRRHERETKRAAKIAGRGATPATRPPADPGGSSSQAPPGSPPRGQP